MFFWGRHLACRFPGYFVCLKVHSHEKRELKGSLVVMVQFSPWVLV